MKNITLKVAVGYSIWVLINLVITIANIGDGGVNAHLALIFTGLPISLFSLQVQHGSLIGVVLAGVLGIVQWVAITKFMTFRRKSSNGT